jgi:AraC-like DNA-binding protein
MDYRSKVLGSLAYIEQNLDDKISLDELAQAAHLSKYHFHRLFHKITGESVSKYINKRRMKKASEELLQADQPIIDIALKYQYGSQEAFSRAFYRIYGLTPGRYRRIHTLVKSGKVVGLCLPFNKTMDIAA